MPKTAAELRADKAGLVQKAEGLNTLADKEGRDLTDAEHAEFTDHITRARGLDAEITRADRREALADAGAELRRSQGRRVPAFGDGGFEAVVDRGQVLRNWFLAGTEHGDFSGEAIHRARAAGINLHAKTVVLRALTTGASPGSSLVASVTKNELIEALRSSSPLLGRLAVDVTSDGSDRIYPTADDTGNEAEIISENTVFSDQDPSFGGVTIPTFLYSSKMVKASISMLQDSLVDLNGYVNRTIVGRVQQALERHVTVGTGTGQPQGLRAAAGAGVTAASLANPSFADVVDLEHSVPEQYRANGVYVVSDGCLKRLKKLTDSTGRPLWQPSIAAGVPSTINGRPYIMSPYLADWGASAIPMLFGDLSGYTLRQALGTTITRLDERYAEYGLVAWCGLARFGGKYTGTAAGLKKLTCPAS